MAQKCCLLCSFGLQGCLPGACLLTTPVQEERKCARVAAVGVLGDEQVQGRVAQKLQALVAAPWRLWQAGVCDGGQRQPGVLEGVVCDLLQPPVRNVIQSEYAA